MFTLIIGGSASGKSAYAEEHVLSLSGQRIYLATMKAGDAESLSRIEKHRRARAGKGFSTLECYEKLELLQVPPDGNALLEDLGNLLANAMFSPGGGGADEVLIGIRKLRSSLLNLTIVTNEVFSGGSRYDAETLRYLRELARLNRIFAAEADRVIEVVCGCENALKKEPAILQHEFGFAGESGGANMIFITGPMFSGKRDYACKLLGCEMEELEKYAVWDIQMMAKPEADLEVLADQLSLHSVVIASEIGGGVVPIDPEERKQREAAGRLACCLAERADTVIRVCCGLPQFLKGG